MITLGDGIARVYGLDKVMAGELLSFPHGIAGIAMNLEEDQVGVVILGEYTEIKEGDEVKRTGKIISVPVGEAMIGRVVNSLGQPIDDKGPIATSQFIPLERLAPGVIDRQPVREPMATGLKAIDSMIPIGRGQRELIIGDRQTGKDRGCARHDHQQQGQRSDLHLQRDRSKALVDCAGRARFSKTRARWNTRSSSRRRPPSLRRCSTFRHMRRALWANISVTQSAMHW